MDFLQGLSSSGPVVLGLAIGCMCAFDMGGPVNKAAYTTGTLLLGTALEAGVGTETYNFGTNFMAAVSAACIVPPLITTSPSSWQSGLSRRPRRGYRQPHPRLHLHHQGAIPFMTKNIIPVMPIMMIGSSIASILTIFFNVHYPAPHGGFLVLPVVENGPLWVLAILVGTVVGGVLFTAFKKYDYDKNAKKADEQPVLETAGTATAAVKAAPAAQAPQTIDFVKPDQVFVGESFASRDELLTFVSKKAVEQGIAQDADELMSAFIAREDMGTTGMTDNFAIPHAKSTTVTNAAVMAIKTSDIAGWETLDQKPVEVAIALLIPDTEAGTTHLKLLSKVAEALMDDEFRSAVKGTDDAATIAKLINDRLNA